METGTFAQSPSELLAVIADPHRWRLLGELARSDRRVGELTTLLGRPQNVVSYHLGELRSAGLVSSRRSSADGRDVYYRANLHRCRDAIAAASSALHPGLRLTPAGPMAMSSGSSVSTSPDAARRASRTTTSGRRPRVLFLCTGNSARSQMAAALLEARSDGRIEACSAGTAPKALNPAAVQVMAERGIDIAGNPTTHLRRYARSRFDRVVTLCDKVREVCPKFPGPAPMAHWSIADPTADPAVVRAAGAGDPAREDALSPFRLVADELELRVELLIEELTNPPTRRTTS